MFDFIKKLFSIFKKEKKTTVETPVEKPVFVQAEPEFTELQKTVMELMDKNQSVFLFHDEDGAKLKELKSLLERRGYFVYFINNNDRVGPYNIFRHMTEDNYKEYVQILSLDNKTESVRNLNALLLTPILLSMIETQELSWKGFTSRLDSISRSTPEFVAASVDETIERAFSAFKEQVRHELFFEKEFALLKKEKYQECESYVPEGKIAVFYKEYTGEDTFLNKALLLETNEKGRL